jgi:glycosyltransferase involved in cell wall biosynthesis
VKVAIVHDWMGPMTGAERVLEQMLAVYPDADVFTSVDFLPSRERHRLRGARVRTSFIQRLPGAASHIWHYVPLMPFAMEQFDLRAYDLILSNSHAVAKGVIVHPHQVHVCYLMSPMRFVWDLQAEYLEAHGYRGLKGLFARLVFARLRSWDFATSARVDVYLSISRFIAWRAEQAYGRASVILPPPVDTEFFTPGATREDFYLAASRLTPFKNIAAIVEAFRAMPDRRLVVIGDGPERDRVRALAGPNVTLLGYQSNEVLRDHLRRARALVFAAPEDFGLIMAESHACGTPVIALGRGGAADIVVTHGADRNGLLFDSAAPTSIATAVRDFEALPAISRDACRRGAERFRPELFRERLRAAVDVAVSGQSGSGGVFSRDDALRDRIRRAVERETAVASDAKDAALPRLRA